MTHSLPDRPSLEFLKNQAKDLLRAARAGDPTALARWSVSPPTDRSAFQLADAQRVVAREYGFSSWPQLKQHVLDQVFAQQQRREQVDELVRCCLEGPASRAERLAERHADLAKSSPFVAACVGDVESLSALLDAQPQLLKEVGGPYDAPLLYYACASHLVRPGRPREILVRAVVEQLLARGADPNAARIVKGTPDCPLSSLYAASGINGNPPLTKRLLEAGATPDDNESLYHSVEHADTQCTELLLAHHARIEGTNAVPHAVTLGNLAAVKLFLQQGADVNQSLGGQPGMTLLHLAIENNQGREMLELLMDHGANLEAIGSDGITPFRRAAFRGHRVAMELLQARGISESLPEGELFLSVCMMGDASRAKELMAAHPDIVRKMPHQGHGLLFAAAWRGCLEAVRVMLAVGFDAGSPTPQRATALHAASWHGHVGLVELLLGAGAPLDGKDLQFHCTPLEWALHGSANCPAVGSSRSREARDADYAKVVSLLVAAGSPAPVARLVSIVSDELQDLLR